MTTPYPLHVRHATHVPDADERISPVEHVGRDDDEEDEEDDDDDGGLTDPAAQPEHCPLQVDTVNPALLPYVPLGQAVHEEAPAAEE